MRIKCRFVHADDLPSFDPLLRWRWLLMTVVAGLPGASTMLAETFCGGSVGAAGSSQRASLRPRASKHATRVCRISTAITICAYRYWIPMRLPWMITASISDHLQHVRGSWHIADHSIPAGLARALGHFGIWRYGRGGHSLTALGMTRQTNTRCGLLQPRLF
jgi:hypothetical protein